MFFAGVTNIMLAMLWWAAWLLSSRWPQLFLMRYPPVFPGWLHAFVMQYQMLPSFIFGFLLTTFPKWTKLPDVAPRRFVPVGLAFVAGQLVTLAGALGSHAAIVAGVALTLVGWTAGLAILVPMLWREEGTTWHARSCVAALALVPRDEVSQQHGYVHAGVLAALVDTAGGYAGFTLFPRDASVLTVEFKLNLVAPARGRRLVAEGFVVKPGRTLAITRGEVYAESGQARTLVALMQQTLIVMRDTPDA